MALSRSVTLCQGDVCDVVLARIDALRRAKTAPDIIVKLIGLALTIFVFSMTISYAVPVCMVWMQSPCAPKPRRRKFRT